MNLTQKDIDRADAEWAVQLAEINKRFNPNHNPGGSPEGGEFASDDSASELTDRAVKEFGLTDDPREAGYILQDGRMLDFSGKKRGSTVSGVRYMDHREVSSVYPDDGDAKDFHDFVATTGAIRFSAFADGHVDVELVTGHAFTKAQQDSIGMALVDGDDNYITLSIVDNRGRELGSTHEGNVTVDDLDRVYRDARRDAKTKELKGRSVRFNYKGGPKRSLRFNKNHDDKGKFASGDGGSADNKTEDIQGSPRDTLDREQLGVDQGGFPARADYVIGKGKQMVEQILARNPDILKKAAVVASLQTKEKENKDLIDTNSKWFQDHWQMAAELRPGQDVFKEHEVEFERVLNEGVRLDTERRAANKEFTDSLAKEMRMEGIPGGKLDVNSKIAGENGPLELLDSPQSVNLDIQSFAHFTGAEGKINAFSTLANRAYYSSAAVPQAGTHAFAGAIFLPNMVDGSTVWHELGHWMEETTPGGSKAATSFLFNRTVGEDAKPIGELTSQKNGYAAWEKTRADHFMDAYTGKVYGNNASGYSSTEITSMGMQHMKEDPGFFLRNDPEHFYFTLGMIRARKEGGFAW